METIKQQVESKLDGRKFRWFYDTYVYEVIDLSYPGFMAQLNGYTSGLSPDLKPIIDNFLRNSASTSDAGI